jgi:hypothetical protein
MNLAEILTAIKSNHARVTQSGTDTKESIARTGVKLAIQEIPKFHDFDVLRTSVDMAIQAGDGSLTLPDGILKIEEVRYMNGLLSYMIPLKNRELVTRGYPDVDTLAASYPIMCYQEGSQLYLAPRSRIALPIRIQYTVLPAFDDADDSSSLTPAIPLIDKYLICYATAWVFNSLQMFNESAAYNSQAVAQLQAAIAYDLRHPGEDRRIQPFAPSERRVMNPLDPFNFETNSVPW